MWKLDLSSDPWSEYWVWNWRQIRSGVVNIEVEWEVGAGRARGRSKPVMARAERCGRRNSCRVGSV